MVRTSWRSLRRDWDRMQTAYLPRREERFGALVEFVATRGPSRPCLIDLGTGTGALAERLLRRLPRCSVVAVDYDPVTMRIGREVLGDASGRLTWVDADLRSSRWMDALPAHRFDAAVTTTALHWLRAPALSRLFADLHQLIRPGGLFLNGDTMRFGRTSHRLGRWARETRRRLNEQATRPAPPGRGWEDWWKAALAWPPLAAEADLHRQRYPTAHGTEPGVDAERQAAALRRAGFREVATVWQWFDDRILAAVA